MANSKSANQKIRYNPLTKFSSISGERMPLMVTSLKIAWIASLLLACRCLSTSCFEARCGGKRRFLCAVRRDKLTQFFHIFDNQQQVLGAPGKSSLIDREKICADRHFDGHKHVGVTHRQPAIPHQTDFGNIFPRHKDCLLYTSPSPRDRTRSRMPSSA